MQQEWFEELKTQARPRASVLFPHRFLRMRIAYEDGIFLSLAFLLVLLAGFCLGVERGRHLDVQTSAEVRAAGSTELPELPLASAAAAHVPSDPRQNPTYAIQLASYLDIKSAEAEAKRLKRLGFEPQVVKGGRYYELRVSGFTSRELALSSLAKLKKTYRDGFVKRVSS